MAYSSATKFASRHFETALFSFLRDVGFRKKGRIASRQRGEYEHTIELVNVASQGCECPQFRLYGGVYADAFMRSVSEDYDELGHSFPLFYVEPQDLDRRAMGDQMKHPVMVCSEEDSRVALERFKDHCARFYFPFFEACSSLDGIMKYIRGGLVYWGHEAQGEAFLRIIEGKGSKWVWKDHIDNNLVRAGLDPSEFRYGYRIRVDELLG